ncbi:RNA polymerase factor sigma-54 [Magnetofaba australis]|uniref:RNA polymerase sigma-54 factor n=1 Tax=Magnetofaba australis IT-1 TaxID=1434232 RepID=A0A1Y2K0R9_9PROT|nr:RNA polymerase factor sigma-54 [Magnetofaba australis]OSM01631.1 putative RNA polymerase sigma 54 subunit RpoN [Magnetofaba australis IT-1]
MALGLELKLRMGMQLVMTPQLQMAIRLLQMSSLDLQEYLQEELEKNPLLEREDDGGGDGLTDSGGDMIDSGSGGSTEAESSYAESGRSEGDDDGGSDFDSGNDYDGGSDSDSDYQMASETTPDDARINDDLPVDANWEDVYSDAASHSSFENAPANQSSEAPPLENTISRGESLTDHLMWQLGVSARDDTERVLGMAIIDAIDENGYLCMSLEALAEATGADFEDLDDVLVLIQSFEPSGVGARSLAECLRLQLKAEKLAKPPYTDLLENLEDLAKRDFRKLSRTLKLTEEELADAVSVIQSLDPKPGLAFGSDQPSYVVPDVYVRKLQGRWVVEVNPDTQPRLRLNRLYQDSLGRQVSPQEKRFLQENARSAQWLIKSLEQRSSTIYRVAESIVRFQEEFLEKGPEYLKPLILKDVADDIGVHESTTSRVTSNKYMHTPRGIFELKYFFSSSLGSQTGEAHSSEAVKYKIRKLVDEEPPRRPYSDEKLAKLLGEQGIKVARRTVAKYRESLGIPSSSRRKQLGG